MAGVPDYYAIYPYQLEPVIKEKVWGGRNLETVLGKTLPPKVMIGETWEAWEGCIVENGIYQGQTLDRVMDQDAAGVLGSASVGGRRLPLLFKFIDAQDDLSVQVHPDDAQARARENYAFGKTEAWYILHAEPNAKLILGFNRDVRRDEITASIANDTLTHLLASAPVQRGDVLFVPAGTVHAIGKGIVLAEIQENSDITYRLYDWGRAVQGRALHVAQSLDVLDFGRLDDAKIPSLTIHHPHFDQHYLVACRYFVLELLEVRQPTPSLALNEKFQILSVITGAADIAYGNQSSIVAKQGQTFLLPAQLGAYVISPRTSCRLLRAYVPDLEREVVVPLIRAGYDKASIMRLGGPAREHNDLLVAIRE
ncbi:MAG: class I mannose-6-phosphate isomerase [Chloroflexi bacterium]|nr:class I mannose-6-phosphate isomerase [Chloroflexota bacterium]